MEKQQQIKFLPCEVKIGPLFRKVQQDDFVQGSNGRILKLVGPVPFQTLLPIAIHLVFEDDIIASTKESLNLPNIHDSIRKQIYTNAVYRLKCVVDGDKMIPWLSDEGYHYVTVSDPIRLPEKFVKEFTMFIDERIEMASSNATQSAYTIVKSFIDKYR